MAKVILLDFIEVWARSLEGMLVSLGVNIESGSTQDAPKRSCYVVLRRGEIEAELLLWESGEGELGIVDASGVTTEQHLDGVDIESLGEVLAGLLEAFR